ncbi:MAG: hypothetical protein IJE89_05635 [Bacilli bacterium]|nr:hypothetical protein [Bacilli bacterium]
MVTSEHLDKICEYTLKDRIITTKVLHSFGLNSHDINKLLEQNILRRVNIGQYELISTDTLYEYANKIRKENPYDSIKGNLLVYEMEPNHEYNNLRLLTFYTRKRNYEKAFQILDILYLNNENDKYNDIYLYILSAMTVVPERYKDKVKKLTEVNLKTKYYSSNEDENAMLFRITIGKYVPAIYSLNKTKQYILNEHDVALRLLLSEAIELDNENSELLLRYAKEERFNDIKELLTSKTTVNKQMDLYMLYVVNTILSILKTKKLPIQTTQNTNNLHSAIYTNNFELAYKLNTEYLTKYNLNLVNPLTILLNKVNELINKIRKEQSIESNKEESINIEDENVTLSSLIIELLHNNIEIFTGLLKKYLKEKQLEEYEFLIMKLVKIDIINNDSSYLKTISVLSKLDNSVYNFDVSYYVRQFYQELSNIEIAKIYFEIISKYYPESTVIIANLKNTLENEIAKNNISNEETENVVSLENKEQDEKEINELNELVLRRIHEAKSNNQTIVIFENQSVNMRRIIYSILGSSHGLDMFTIGEEPKTVVVRILNIKQEEIIYKEYLQDLFINAKIKNYQECIRIGNILLKSKGFKPLGAKDPRPVFDIVGQSYLKLNKIEEAIIFLTIVTELSKTMGDSKKDRSVLINMLKERLNKTTEKNSSENEFKEDIVVNEIVSEKVEPIAEGSIEEAKPVENIQITEIEQEENKPREIKDLEEIAYFIKETNISLEDAKNSYNLTDEDILMIRLIYVRDYYVDGMYSLGDSKLKEIEKIQNKTPRVIIFIKELKINKRFYKDRLEFHTKKRQK